MPFQPGAELPHRLDVGAAGVGVADLCREEFQEAVSGAVARRCHEGRGGVAAEGDELVHPLLLSGLSPFPANGMRDLATHVANTNAHSIL